DLGPVMRDLGVTRALSGAVPDILVPVLAVLTFLGSPGFLTVATPVGALLAYRARALSRADAIRLASVALFAIGGITLVKSLLAVPRPPPALHRVPESGFGFPSGHATATTAVLFGTATLAEVSTRRRRLAIATGGVIVIGATRVLLGVHFLVDVIAGVATGLLLLWLGLRLSASSIPVTLGLAASAGLLGTLLSHRIV
ncbi:MAG: phosphatase PAP2 family protein, partial [Halodesulfurarchaeum sp.]